MLKDITIGQHYPSNSVIHRLDARMKLIATFVFMASLFVIDKFWPYAIVFISLIVVIKLSNIPMKYILKGLKPLRWIIIFTFVINVFFLPGDLIWSFGFLKITEQGISQAVFMALRLVFLVLGTSMLTLTTSPMDLTDGIERLLNPFNKIGLPVHELAMMMTIALRFIPTLLEPLFVSAFRRAEELAMAMEARCYRGGYNRTKMRQSIITKSDYIAGCILVVYLVIIIITRFI